MRTAGEKRKTGYMRYITICAAVAAMMVISAVHVCAVSSLAVKAGYHGGPYYDMDSISDGALRQSTQMYTAINRAGYVRELKATGAYLSSIMDSAGIGAWDVDTYYICSTDGSRMSYGAGYLLDGGRYYYPNLRDNYDEDKRELINRKATVKGAVPVKAMLASTVDGSTADRFRLMVGQKDPLDCTFYDFRYNVSTIETDMSGEPEITVTNDKGELKVGEKYKPKLEVKAYNDKLAEAMKKDIKWESSNSAIATVDDDGNVTVKEGGKVRIKAYFECKDGTRFSDEIKFSTSKGSGSGTGEGRGDKDGDGDGSGKGNKKGDGNSSGPHSEGSIRKGGKQITSMRKLSSLTAKNTLDKIDNKRADGSSGGSESQVRDVKVFEIEASEDVDDKLTDNDMALEDIRYTPFILAVFFITVFLLSVTGRMDLFFRQIGNRHDDRSKKRYISWRRRKI